MRIYWVYILASISRRMYVGVTNNLERRVAQHREGVHGFTSRYRMTRLVYYESTGDVRVAIEREKQIKGLLRKKKKALVESLNPDWQNLLSS